MPWVRFKKRFDWMPHPLQTTVYAEGMELLITTACFEAAKAVDAVEKIKAKTTDGKNAGASEP